MKRALSLILSVLFLLTAMPMGMVSAATDAVIKGTVDKTTVAYGGTVTLSVYMENNPGLVCWAVDVGYDNTALELIEQTAGDAYNGIGTLAFGPMEKSTSQALWYDFLNPDVTNNGHLFSYTFKVKEGAAIGESTITLTTIDPDNMLNAAFEAVEFNYENVVVEIMGCAHEYVPTITEPTCGAEGTIVYTCANCGDSYTETVPATGEHKYESAVTVAPTCVVEGVMTYTCSGCGISYTEAIPAIGEHAYDNGCDATCNNCDYVREAVDHVYDNACDADCNECGNIREAAAHAYVNADAPVCAFCGVALDISAPIVYATIDNANVARGDKVTVAVSIKANPGLIGWQFLLNYDAAVLAPVDVVAADTFAGVEFGPVENVPFSAIWLDALNGNNASNGTLYYVTFEVLADAAFGSTIVSVALADANNVFNNDLNAVSIAVAETGIMVLDHTHVYAGDCDAICNECGFVREAGEHTYESAVTTAPTCGAEGVLTYTCSVCGDSYTESIPAGGEHTYESAITTAPTCGAEGVLTYTCSICGDSYTEAIPATGEHTYESAVTIAPTCGAEGVMTYTCSACGASYTEAIPATGEHTYDNECDAACNGCDYIRETVPHLYENADAPVCALCGAALDISAPIVYVTSDNPYVTRGDMVTVAVSMQANPGLVGWKLLLNYDAAVLTPVEVIAADTFAGVEFGPVENVPFSAIWLDALNGNNAANGTLYYVTFEVKADAAFGTSALALGVTDADDLFDNDLTAVSFILGDCGINVLDHIHAYDNACDADCNECGYIREVGDHVYDAECDADCNKCGAIRDVVPHLYENADAPVCALCGAALDISAPIVYTTTNNPYVARGDKVTVAVAMQANPGLVGWQFLLNYDAAVLAPIEATAGDAFTAVEFGPVENVPFSAIWLDALNGNNAANGTLYYVTFEVLADAAFGTTTLAVAVADPDNIFDNDLNVVSFAVAESGIKVLDHTHVYDNACDTECNECGYIREVDEHTYESVVTTAPTCEAEGLMTYTCSVCGVSYTEAIPALGHTYEAVVTAPTCVDKGYTTYTCSVCGDSYIADEVDALGHKYESVVTTAPTCVAEGLMTYTCSVCGDTYTEAIPATGEHVYEAVVTAPTCVDKGYTTYTCSVCGDSYIADEVDALGHKYESVVTTAPTCVAEGLMTYTCSVCGDTYTEAIPATGEHTYEAVVTAPTCVDKGYTTYTCSVCGDSYIADEVDALGHKYESVVTTAPTCVAEGLMTYTCSVCGDTYTEAIPATGEHTYESVVTTAPTCGAEGLMTYTCSVCGATYPEAIPATGEHTYSHDYDADCNVCGAIREVDGMLGDVNGDGKINTRDIALYQQYVNAWNPEIFYIEFADVNCDGKINTRDIALMQQYINGWGVEFGPQNKA